MKLLTLNTHSLIEENYKQKLSDFVLAIIRELPDVIALQEVNQRQDAPTVSQENLHGYTPCEAAQIRHGNHVLRVVEELRLANVNYYWTWLPIKRGYAKYDEGVAIMSRTPIEATDTLKISRTDHYNNWKTRRLLGVRLGHVWFYCVHLGWWDDPDEPFALQWEKINAHMADRGSVFLMGDFNSPAETRNEGYDLIIRDGWIDTYALALQKDSGITVSGRIAGWTHRELPQKGARVDHIFCNTPCRVHSSVVIFNGDHKPVVSDHFGVMLETEDL